MNFAVWAPNASRVELLMWAPGPLQPIEMARTDDDWWFVDCEAADGWEYLFRLWTGANSVDRIDPRARAVTNSVGRGIVQSIETHDRKGYTPPPLNEMVIYELHPGTFGGDLDGVSKRLDHLHQLGVNAIELMPLGEFAGDVSWGYNPAMPFAVESTYGGPAALRRLVDAAHEYGLAVIVDVVYNHLGPSDLDLWRFDGWFENEGGGIYFYNDERAQTPWGATRPDYGREEVRHFLIDNARMWFAEYGVDGLRLDSTVNIRNIYGEGGDAGRLDAGADFLRELNDVIHHEFPYAIMIAEDLQDDPTITIATSEGGLGFDLQWSARFVHTVRASLISPNDDDRHVDELAHVIRAGDDATRIVYTESHDEVANGSTRVPAEIDASDPHSVHAFRRTAIGAVLMMACPGVPMIFQGQEWTDTDWFDDGRDLDWTRVDEHAGSVTMWRDLIRLRRFDERTGGLRGDQTEVTTWENGEQNNGVIIIRRWGLGGRQDATVVAINLFSNDLPFVELDLDPDRRWECLFASDWSGYHAGGSDSVTSVGDGGCPLPPYGAVVITPASGGADG
jgi:1,4-alpha-glucan branching enzyme